MKCLQALVLAGLSFLLLATLGLAVSLSKNGCQEKCGNVTIPYPFGIGSQCALNSSFIILCNNSTPILSRTSLQVLSISLENGIVTTKLPISPMNCSSEQVTLSLGMSLEASGFTVSKYYNSFAVIGCQNVVSFHADEAWRATCHAICDAKSPSTSCTGVNCCKTEILHNFKALEITYRSINPSGRTSGFCGYAVLAEKKWIREVYGVHKRLHQNILSPFDEGLVYATMVLEWDISKIIFSPYSNGCYYRRRVSPSVYQDRLILLIKNNIISDVLVLMGLKGILI